MRLATVTLRNLKSGRTITINAAEYGRDLGKWARGWKIVTETHGETEQPLHLSIAKSVAAQALIGTELAAREGLALRFEDSTIYVAGEHATVGIQVTDAGICRFVRISADGAITPVEGTDTPVDQVEAELAKLEDEQTPPAPRAPEYTQEQLAELYGVELAKIAPGAPQTAAGAGQSITPGQTEPGAGAEKTGQDAPNSGSGSETAPAKPAKAKKAAAKPAGSTEQAA